MHGTIIEGLKLTKVVDGDTIKVEINNKEESLRLACLDTEESWAGGAKPVTNAGKFASAWAKQYFGVNDEGYPTEDIRVNIEFDTNDPEHVCFERHRGNYGRLICYVHKGNENYNLQTVKKGWSPYFVKYGRSRMYHLDLLEAESEAQSKKLHIWNPNTNAGGKSRDYASLVPWWHLRDTAVRDYRHFGIQAGAKSVRLDYIDILEAAKAGNQLTVFCDLQSGINKWAGGGALIFAGSIHHKFNLWIPHVDSEAAQKIINLVETRYAGHGRGYVYVTGNAILYPPTGNGKPEIEITNVNQLSDVPPGL